MPATVVLQVRPGQVWSGSNDMLLSLSRHRPGINLSLESIQV
jgi:hypothetical protein